MLQPILDVMLTELLTCVFTDDTSDFNSIFFTQYRIGKDGNLFKFYKFRTMVPNADDVLFELLKKDKKLAKRLRNLYND